MALPQSSLSRVCRAITDFVGTGLNASSHSIRVMLGLPGDAVPSSSGVEHHINLFFYRIEPSGFYGAVLPDEPWLLRLHCLITAFGVTEGTVSAGENDLRLLGEVVRLFHENPVLPSVDVDGEQVQAQVLFQPIGLDDINHLWGTQGDISYRPSVAYEMSLVPVVPHQRNLGSPLVGSVGSQVRGDMAARHAAFSGTMQAAAVPRKLIATQLESWAPAICLVADGECALSLSFALGSGELTAFTPAVWIAGEAGSPVSLVWEAWDNSSGWHAVGSATSTTASGPELDPAQVGGATPVSVPMPLKDIAGQLVLYAERDYSRAADGVTLSVRSNPLLINLY